MLLQRLHRDAVALHANLITSLAAQPQVRDEDLKIPRSGVTHLTLSAEVLG